MQWHMQSAIRLWMENHHLRRAERIVEQIFEDYDSRVGGRQDRPEPERETCRNAKGKVSWESIHPSADTGKPKYLAQNTIRSSGENCLRESSAGGKRVRQSLEGGRPPSAGTREELFGGVIWCAECTGGMQPYPATGIRTGQCHKMECHIYDWQEQKAARTVLLQTGRQSRCV